MNGKLATALPEALAFGFMPSIQVSTRRLSFWLQDRSSGSVGFLDQHLQAFAAARKRPDSRASLFSASVPQIYANVDQDKALKQGVAVGDLSTPNLLGGL